MDEINWWEQMSWYESMESQTFDVMSAWANAQYEINPVTGQQTWAATLPSNAVETVTDISTYNWKLDSSYNSYVHAHTATLNFESTYSICS